MRYPSAECGRAVLKSTTQAAILARASSRSKNSVSLRSSSRNAPVEAFDEAVLHRLSWGNEVPVDFVVAAPGQHGVASVFGAVIADDHARLAMPLDECGQLACHAPARDRRVRDRTEALLRHIVDDVEDAEAAPVRELIVDEVRGPGAFGFASTRMGARVPTALRRVRRLRTESPSSR